MFDMTWPEEEAPANDEILHSDLEIGFSDDDDDDDGGRASSVYVAIKCLLQAFPEVEDMLRYDLCERLLDVA